MFQHDWMLSKLAEERRRDLMREVEHDRLVRQAQSIPIVCGHALYHMLDRVGQHLIQWGERLQARHAACHTSLSTSREIPHG